MAPRRHRSVSNVQNAQLATPSPPPQSQRTQTPNANSQRQLGMLPAVYQSNMKVLHRREPSITAIIDQFSHVCIYQHNGNKWEKHGYEGSMFIFEKSTYPTYGFYILNRMGTEDYVRAIYPEDDYEIIGQYLMCRFYTDFTQTRLEMNLPYPIPPEMQSAFEAELFKKIPPDERDKYKDKEKKGRSTTLGLWMFATDAREPLKEVMMRLHSYVKRGLPYPDEFRYGPGRPPPPNPHLRTASSASAHAPQDRSNGTQTAPPDGSMLGQSAPPSDNVSASELDKLFAKLLPPAQSAPAPQPPAPTSGISVMDLFASLGDGSQHHPSTTQPPTTTPTAAPPLTGQPLLQMMFASASQTRESSIYPTINQPLPPQPEEIVIVSPKPQSSTLPQILTQDVISTLMGFGPDSRASSAAPSSAGSRRSGPRYEGDNEYSEGDFPSEGETLRSTTARQPSHSSRHIPSLSVPRTPSSPEEELVGNSKSGRRISGDVTPRPPAGGARLPPTSPPQFQNRVGTPSANGKVNGSGAVPSPAPASADARARTLVPFEANSDLWPYPRAPLDDRSFEQDDVVELDFTDTRALSDPTIFSNRLKEKKDRKEKGRKSRKEREKEREREKAEIEKGWDLPTQTGGQPAYQSSATGPVAEAATSATQPLPKPVKKPVANGYSTNDALDTAAAKDAILSALAGKTLGSDQPNIGRNDFMRELLTLIHTKPEFVDNLWQQYISHAQ